MSGRTWDEAEMARLDREYVRRAARRAADPVVRRLRRDLRPRVQTPAQELDAARAAWLHLAQLGLISPVVTEVLSRAA